MSKKNHINAKDMAVLSAAMHKEANGTSTDADKTVDAIINDLAINFKGRPKKVKASINTVSYTHLTLPTNREV